MPLLSNFVGKFFRGSRVPPAPVPVAGAELLVNGNFAAWTAGVPDWWTVSATAPNAVTQIGTGESYGGAGIGSANIYRVNATGEPNLLRSSLLSVGTWYRSVTDISAINSGKSITIGDALFGFSGLLSSVGTNQPVCGRSLHPRFVLTSQVDGTDATIDNVSLVPLTLASLISTRPYASADCDISAAVTRTAGTQAGLTARVDNPANPQNFIIAYLDGGGNVKVDKCLAGTYTNVISGAVTYGAGYILRLVCNGNNISCYYNGTQVGSTTAVADAGIVGNKNHGLFSTYAGNTFTGYVAA